ncbi:helix-turn-helix domain-containing protein [Dactylosporangium sp. NPDC049140]|uniref:nSTAND1 domain-containing NTPase n=1 Tax=Dactylosporangium sp. NPDC049140 TaxID=3155647 RepID=UPI0033CE95D0
MPRTERPLDDGDDALTAFAAELRMLRKKAGNPPYRKLAQLAHYSSSTLADAAAGHRLPSLNVTQAYVRACGADPAEWEQRWHAVAADLAEVAGAADPGADPPDTGCPYVGLVAFQAVDADRFFGRERLTAQLVERVRVHRLVVVFGASGSGKSSLLRAGLLPRMPAAVLFTPGPRPLQECAAQLAAAGGGSALTVHRDLAASPEALHLAVLQALASVPAGAELLILVDQFEEVFTQCEDEGERERLIAALVYAAEAPNSRCRVVLGVRADFYPHCLRRLELATALGEAHFPVPPMTTEELRRAVSQPAVDAGCTIEGALVARIIAEATGRPGVLPLVSHALRETWLRRRGNALTLTGYEASGGLRHALARTADTVYTGLGPERQRLARSVFRQLVAVGEGTDDTKRPVERDRLSASTAPVLEALAAARLVTLDIHTVELAHEALLQAWPRFRAWIDEDRAGLLMQQQLSDAAAQWQRDKRDPAQLYRGTRLAAAIDWASHHAEDVRGSATITQFLSASNRHANRVARLRMAAFAALCVLVVLAAGGAAVAVRQRADARAALVRAVAAQTASEAQQVRGTDVSLAAQLSLASYRLRPTPRTYADLISTENTPLSTELTGHTGAVYNVAFSGDGGTLASAGRDGTVRLWNMTGTGPRMLGAALATGTGYVYWVAFSPDRHTLATAGRDGTVRLWNMTDPAHPVPWGPPLRGHTSYVFSVAFSADGTTLVSAGYDHRLILWNVADPAHATAWGPPIDAGSAAIASATFSPDGRTVASAGHDHTIRLWNVTDPARPAPLGAPVAGHTDTVYAVAFSPDGHTLASVGDRTVRLWDLADPARPVALGQPLAGHTDTIYAIAFSPDGRTLATAGADQGIRLWDVADPARPVALGRPLAGHTGYVYWLAFRPDGTALATASGDGTVRLWDLPPTVRTDHTNYVNTVAFRPTDGAVLASGGSDGTVRLWGVDGAGHPARLGPPLAGHAAAVVSVAFSRDGRTLATSARDHTVRLWNVTDPAHPAPAGAPLPAKATVGWLRFSPGKDILAAAVADGTIQLWDVADPAVPRLAGQVAGRPDTAYRLAFSPDGGTLASGGTDDTLQLWNVADPARPVAWAPPRTTTAGGVVGVAFSPDGHTVATANQDHTLRLWNVTDPADPTPIGEPLTGHTGIVYSVGFTPDGATLVSSSDDGTIRLWDVTDPAHPAEVGPLAGHTAAVDTVAVSPSRAVLASASDDHTMMLWDLDVDHAIARICAVTGGALDAQRWRRYIPEMAYRRPC